MYARTNRCYKQRGSRTNYVCSSIPHCITTHAKMCSRHPNIRATRASDQWRGCDNIEMRSPGRLNFTPWGLVFVGSILRNLLHIISPAPRILRCLTDFWKNPWTSNKWHLPTRISGVTYKKKVIFTRKNVKYFQHTTREKILARERNLDKYVQLLTAECDYI